MGSTPTPGTENAQPNGARAERLREMSDADNAPGRHPHGQIDPRRGIHTVRRLLASAPIVALAAIGLPIALAVSASAAPPSTSPPGAAVSGDNTVCADHGGFRSLGTFGSSPLHDIGVNNPGSNLRPGATSWMFPNLTTGSTTGGNNNAICGGGNVPPPFAGP